MEKVSEIRGNIILKSMGNRCRIRARKSNAKIRENVYFGVISGVFGSQRILNGIHRRPHYGIDIAAPVGAPVVSPADAIVAMVHNDMYYTGGTIILDHGHGLTSAMLHMKQIVVKEGERVQQGQKIGTVGQSGRSTGPHLDWRINLFEARLDPAFLVPPMPIKAE